MIQDFRNKVQALDSTLDTLTRVLDDLVTREEVYEANMKSLSKQNKQLEERRNQAIEKEQENIKQSVSLSQREQAIQKKDQEQLIKDGGVRHDREVLIQEQAQLKREREQLEKDKLKEEVIRGLRTELEAKIKEYETKEKILEERERIYNEKNDKLKILQKQVEERQRYLQSLM